VNEYYIFDKAVWCYFSGVMDNGQMHEDLSQISSGFCATKKLSKSAHMYRVTLSHPFNGPLSGTIRVSRYQKGTTNLDFTDARDSEWQWHQLGHMQVCTSLQTDNHAGTPPLSFFTGRMPFLPPNQQRQRTESTLYRVIQEVTGCRTTM